MRALWILVVVVVGCMQPVIWGMNLRVNKETGPIEAATILHLVGTFAGIGWWLAGMRGQGLAGIGQIPWWGWLGGVVGLTCMAATTRAMPAIGVSAALAIMVAAQFGSSVLFEHFGLLGLDPRPASLARFAGVAMLALGAWLVSR